MNSFTKDELLLRAVYPVEMRPEFWEGERISSAALKDERGLSVERTNGRPLTEAIDYIRNHLEGYIVSMSVGMCWNVKAIVLDKSNEKNPFHCEVHGSEREKVLSDQQAIDLAREARIEYPFQSTIYITW